MIALVSGGHGFIGKSVVKELMLHSEIKTIVVASRSGADYWSHDCGTNKWTILHDYMDLSVDDSVINVLDTHRPNYIFHLGANPTVKKEIGCRISDTNILGTHHLLEYCEPGTRFAFASSATVYGDGYGAEDIAPSPTSVYAATKVASEALVDGYTSLGKISSVIFRLVANVGGLATHGVLVDLYRKLRSDSPELELLGEYPGSKKPYTYVGDTARFIVNTTLDASLAGKVNVMPYDAGYLSIDSIADLLMQTVGIRKPKKWLGEGANWAGDQKELRVAAEKALFWGFHPEYPSSKLAVLKAARELMGRHDS